jgi:flagellar basal-body rod protein FlgF
MKTLEIAAQAMQADLQRLTHLSQNLANSQTPGYKRMVSVQRPFALQMEATGTPLTSTVQSPSLLPSMSGVDPLDSALDSTAGSLRSTGNPMDLAIDGDGFFVVQTAQGPALTRLASLRMDAQGAIVNDAGLPVLGQGGSLRAPTATSVLSVDAKGEVWADARSIGRLQVLQVSDAKTLQPLGGGLYRSSDKNLGEPTETPRIRAGYQEASNVNSSNEMVRLMETSRHFEAIARTVQGYDDAMEKAIRKLGDL